ncbi:hypothetical protein CPC16_007059 [Podila verticillata]|nr:hypothetical protein CPC16_007059 [Podila verticillata]
MPHPNAVLIPELAFEIQQHLQLCDLAVATRVCRDWFEAWTPFLYYAVKFNGRWTPSLPSHGSASPTRLSSPQPLRRHRSLSHQHQAPPFLNLDKYGHWIKSLQASNLFLDPTEHLFRPFSPCGSSSPPSSSPFTITTTTTTTTHITDHLHLIKNCKSLDLTQLDISNTIMSLERLDDLLSALPLLKVFKFEVMNQIDSTSLTASKLLAFDSSGFRYRQGANKTWMDSLLGLEPEVVRVIARRLSSRLEKLELSFALPATISLAVFEELLESCRSTLKTLVLFKAEICQVDYSREESRAHQMQIEALLANLWETSIGSVELPSTTLRPGHTQLTRSWMTSSSSSSSFSSSYSTSASSLSGQDNNQPKPVSTPPVLESLSFLTCAIPNKEFDWFLQRAPGLKELTIHSCDHLSQPIVASIHTYAPLLESISLSSIPGLSKRGLKGIFEPFPEEINVPSLDHPPPKKLGLRIIRLAYLRQLEDSVMESLATHQGQTLTTLSVHWCPHVTDNGVQLIFKSCEKLEDLSLCLTKPTLNSIKKRAGQKPWACTQSLKSLEIGGQMFLDQLRQSNEHLHPQLYHHMSSNPHQSQTGYRTRALSANSSFTSTYGHRNNTIGACFSNSGSSAGNIIQNTYAVAHHQGYPMYHLLRYQQLSNPLKELQERLEMLPRLVHLGIQSKGIEHLIKQGFGPSVRIRSLALLNQHGRVWSVDEVRDLLGNMPSLTRLQCERNTIMADSGPAITMGQQEEMRQLLENRNVELVYQTPSSTRVL